MWNPPNCNAPASLRAVMAVAWYGIRTWLASTAVVLLTPQLAPGPDACHRHSAATAPRP
nr:cytosine permease [Streptomyces natalensis]